MESDALTVVQKRGPISEVGLLLPVDAIASRERTERAVQAMIGAAGETWGREDRLPRVSGGSLGLRIRL